MFANFATAISTSTAVTLALFYTMNLLIQLQPQALVEPRDRLQLSMVRVPKDENPPETYQPPPDREFIKPPLPPRTEMQNNSDSVTGFSRPKTAQAPKPRMTGTALIIQDGPLIPLVRVSPTYPTIARQAGLEGWVLVQFDVLASGNVSNIRIVESSDRIFEKSARKAASRFRFKPRVNDGVALETTGVQNIFRYRMEN